MAIRLVLADDHPLILDGLENLFRREDGFSVIDRCSETASAFQAVQKHSPDILLLDISMPGGGGMELARKIQAANLPTRVVIFTASISEHDLVEAVRLGIKGIVLKDMPSNLLIQCIRVVHNGGHWVERSSARSALERIMRNEAVGAWSLSPREIDLVRLVAKGLRNREIADRLCISEGTVKVHLHNIYEKLKVDNRVALLRYVSEYGLL